MPLNRLTPPNMQAVDPTTGRPASLGKVYFYTAGTTAPKSAYIDREGTIPAPNPMPLDAGGMCDVYLDGLYRIEVWNAGGVKLYDRDYVSAESGGGGGTVDGALLAVNNLADLADRAAARQVLGLAKQDSATDATAGRVLGVGGFGLGGDAPRASTAQALNDVGLQTGWLSVALADVALVGGPNGAPAGVCQTIRYGVGSLAQAYYPMSGSNGTPWRRVYTAGAWTPWRVDQASWQETSGWYTRRADGQQVCVAAKITATFASADNLLATWTFPIGFADRPIFASATLRPDGEGANSTTIADACTPGMLDLLAPVVGSITPTSCHFRIYHRGGSVGFVAGNTLTLMCRAEGRWY